MRKIFPIIASTYLGGPYDDGGRAIAITGGNVYVAGLASALNFPTTPGACRLSGTGVGDKGNTFVTKLPDTLAGPLVYSTYLGGQTTIINGLDVDVAGNAYVVGSTLDGISIEGNTRW